MEEVEVEEVEVEEVEVEEEEVEEEDGKGDGEGEVQLGAFAAAEEAALRAAMSADGRAAAQIAAAAPPLTIEEPLQQPHAAADQRGSAGCAPVWSAEEDGVILRMVDRYGRKWSALALSTPPSAAALTLALTRTLTLP